MTEPERVCGWCGTDITRRRADALVCGPSCRREIARLRPLFEGKPLAGPYRSVLDRVVRHKRAKALLRSDQAASATGGRRAELVPADESPFDVPEGSPRS